MLRPVMDLLLMTALTEPCQPISIELASHVIFLSSIVTSAACQTASQLAEPNQNPVSYNSHDGWIVTHKPQSRLLTTLSSRVSWKASLIWQSQEIRCRYSVENGVFSGRQPHQEIYKIRRFGDLLCLHHQGSDVTPHAICPVRSIP